jgi:beta-carotene 15,15'-dioxygenase
MNNNFNIIITVFIIWLSLYMSALVELMISGVFVLSLGLMHGSNDINLLQGNKSSQILLSRWKLIMSYIGFGTLIFLAVYHLRTIGILFFLGFSSYHFGEQHLHRRLQGLRRRGLHFFIYGLFIFLLLFSTHIEEINFLVHHMIEIEITGTPFVITFGIMVLLWVKDFGYFKKNILQEFFYLLLFVVVFYNTELYLAFTVYFVVWHAIPSIKDQILLHEDTINQSSLVSYFKQSAVYWIISLVGVFILAKAFDVFGEELLPVLFAASVAITFPHVYLIRQLLSAPPKEDLLDTSKTLH